MKRALAVSLLYGGLLFAQTTNVFIYDSTGNQTTGTMSNGNVYFQDSKGNIAFGTIRNGNVFLNTSKGEITFGTIRDGNVLLIDNKGVTTGIIRNGNIFLTNSDGSITTGTFDQAGNVFTNTTGSRGQTTQQQTDDQRQQDTQQQNYAAGYALGQAMGGVISQIRLRRAINKACFDRRAEGWQLPNGALIRCTDWSKANPRDTKGWPEDSVVTWASIDKLCSDHPKAWYKAQVSGLWRFYSCKEWKKGATK